MKITSTDVKTYLDKFINKFKETDVKLVWNEDEEDPSCSFYNFCFNDVELGYLGIEYFDENDTELDDITLDISVPVGLKIESTINYNKNGSKKTKYKIKFGRNEYFDDKQIDTAVNILKGLILDYKTALVNKRKLEAQGDF